MAFSQHGEATELSLRTAAHGSSIVADSISAWTKNQPRNDELRRFRAEAAELLGIKEPPPERLPMPKPE